jgi:glycosyltransferase involved in cell wall biosynthesis
MNSTRDRRYIAVTPCRNEEKNLPNLMLSILAQTLRPALWVIVDDRSTDKTGGILKEAEKNYGWVKGIHLTEDKEYMGTHISYVCNRGFEFAKDYCNEKDIPYGYIALVDADNILEAKYFEKLIEEFEKDLRLGIASGNSAYADVERELNALRTTKEDVTVMAREFWQLYNSAAMQIRKVGEEYPMGSARMWRKKCFEETGGYAFVPAPDSLSNVKAKLRGWKTKRFRAIKVIEREGSTAQGLWKGYCRIGKASYYLHYNPMHIIAKSISYSFKRPFYTGIALLVGYFGDFILRKEQIEDEEVKRFYGNKWKFFIRKK